MCDCESPRRSIQLDLGCWDRDRGFYEWPSVDGLIDYATVDVAASGYWALELWSATTVQAPRYLIFGTRRKLGANEFLDWSHAENKFSGIVEEMQQRSVQAGHPIKVWIIESNAFARHMTQYEHVKRWTERWKIKIIPHQTQRNKLDPRLGVEGLLPSLYHDGLKRLPYRRGDLDLLNYITAKRAELTTYPEGGSSDTVMADWFAEYHLALGNIHSLARPKRRPNVEELELPPYLARQHERGFWDDGEEDEEAA